MAGAKMTGKAEGEEAGEVRGVGIMVEGSEGSKAGGRALWGCDVD
jgi:hypothetical protein